MVPRAPVQPDPAPRAGRRAGADARRVVALALRARLVRVGPRATYIQLAPVAFPQLRIVGWHYSGQPVHVIGQPGTTVAGFDIDASSNVSLESLTVRPNVKNVGGVAVAIAASDSMSAVSDDVRRGRPAPRRAHQHRARRDERAGARQHVPRVRPRQVVPPARRPAHPHRGQHVPRLLRLRLHPRRRHRRHDRRTTTFDRADASATARAAADVPPQRPAADHGRQATGRSPATTSATPPASARASIWIKPGIGNDERPVHDVMVASNLFWADDASFLYAVRVADEPRGRRACRRTCRS